MPLESNKLTTMYMLTTWVVKAHPPTPSIRASTNAYHIQNSVQIVLNVFW